MHVLTNWKYAVNDNLCIDMCLCVYVCICVPKHINAWVCVFFFHRSKYVTQGVKDSKILFGFTPLCESQWQEVGLTLVLDNCTLPRSVVPILVSLWPSEPARAIFRLHVLLILSCLIPILSDTPPQRSRRQIKGHKWLKGQTVGVLWNCAEIVLKNFLFLICFVEIKLHGFLHKCFLGTLCNQKYFKPCSSCSFTGVILFSKHVLRSAMVQRFRGVAVCWWNQSCALNDAFSALWCGVALSWDVFLQVAATVNIQFRRPITYMMMM